MTPRQFCASGTCDGLKGGVHAVMLVGAAVCCVYNAAAWWYRREPHNGWNVLLYGTLILIERSHVQHHASNPS